MRFSTVTENEKTSFFKIFRWFWADFINEIAVKPCIYNFYDQWKENYSCIQTKNKLFITSLLKKLCLKIVFLDNQSRFQKNNCYSRYKNGWTLPDQWGFCALAILVSQKLENYENGSYHFANRYHIKSRTHCNNYFNFRWKCHNIPSLQYRSETYRPTKSSSWKRIFFLCRKILEIQRILFEISFNISRSITDIKDRKKAVDSLRYELSNEPTFFVYKLPQHSKTIFEKSVLFFSRNIAWKSRKG